MQSVLLAQFSEAVTRLPLGLHDGGSVLETGDESTESFHRDDVLRGGIIWWRESRVLVERRDVGAQGAARRRITRILDSRAAARFLCFFAS
ncbi:MAG: hypothetical protein PHQ28_00875 [Mycobacterium sp.]|nr:hypothetical protein [Mycobacterium sp.]